MPQIAKVAVAAATYAIDKPYDYLIPQGTDIAGGMRVLAPFGRGNRVSEGVVLALGQGVPDKPIKPIRSVVDREPVITDREIRLALWMRERYFCTFYDAIRTILPAAVWYSILFFLFRCFLHLFLFLLFLLILQAFFERMLRLWLFLSRLFRR